MVMKYNMMLLNISFDELMLQYIYCAGKKGAIIKKKICLKKKLLRSVTNS
jgi:hypothetical protein